MKTRTHHILFYFVIFLISLTYQELFFPITNSGFVISADNKVLTVYSDNQDITTAYIIAEEEFRQYLLKKLETDKLAIQFCHFTDDFRNMTAEFTWNDMDYCVTLIDGKICWS